MAMGCEKVADRFFSAVEGAAAAALSMHLHFCGIPT